MANMEDYNAKIETITEIPDEETLEPAMPVDTYLQEGENLAKWSQMDAEKLATIGITPAMLNDLPVRAGALREAQSIWFKDRNSQLDAQRSWAEAAPQAFALRDNLVHDFRYAYRNDPVVLSRVS
jgi:O-succinylbenzoate synthase